MPTQPRSGYSSLQIALHWSIAALVLVQLLFGESMTTVVDAAEEGTTPSGSDQLLSQVHYWVGLTILALVAIRIVVRLTRGAPAADPTLFGKLATAAHVLFYALLILVPVSGLLGYYYGDPWGEWHTLGKPAFIVLIALHAAAALFHHFWLRDATLRRMLTPSDG